MTEKREKYGCLSKSLEKFLHMKEDKRRKKYGNDVNKYYERIVKNVNYLVSDIIHAYENLPEEQREKIDLLTHTDNLVNYVAEKKLEGTPKEIILKTKHQLYAIVKTYVRYKPIQELAEPDFDKVTKWLEYFTPKNPKTKGM